MRPRVLILLVVSLATCAVSPGVAHAQGTISGKVVRLADSMALQGAVVTVAGPGQPPIVQTTGSDGLFSIAASGAGPYSVGVSAVGFKSQALADVSAGPVGSIALAPAIYVPLPVYAGSGAAVAADAQSRVFYALMRQAPEVYRSLDYGGSWQPVTMSYDDPTNGLSGAELADYPSLVTSGVSGEVAVNADSICNNGSVGYPVSYSTDYGLTWRSVGGASYVGNCSHASLRLFWGHARAGAADVLMAAAPLSDGSWNVWRADMSAANPLFAPVSSDPFGQGSQIEVADSASGSFIGRVSAAGVLSFAPLTATGSIVFGLAEVTGLPTPVQLFRLGGVKEASAPPDGALVVGGTEGAYSAVMLSKSVGAAVFDDGSRSAPTVLPQSGPSPCLGTPSQPLNAGSVAPITTGSTGLGNAESCWLVKDGTGPLTVSGGPGEPVGDMAYDAGYGPPGDLVSITQRDGGLTKYSALGAGGVPVLLDKAATAGTDPGSGGSSLTGITAPVVTDLAYGPAGGSELAVASGQVTIASKDGGKSFTEIWNNGSQAVQWWRGASGEWLTFGTGNSACVSMLTALRNWDGSSTVAAPNVAGSSCADFGGPPVGYWGTGSYGVSSLQAVPGTDTVFIGLGIEGQDKYGVGSSVYRARLTATDPPSLTDLVKVAPGGSVSTLSPPHAMAYCPASSAYAPLRDVLFVGTGQPSTAGDNGALVRITGATNATPSVSVVDTVPHDVDGTGVNDVRADCAHGVVYAGTSNPLAQQDLTPLFKSTDGGQTFNRLTITKPDGTTLGDVLGVTAIALNGDGSDVTIAIGNYGAIYHSTDGGANPTSSWTLVRDPTVDRPAEVNDMEFAPGGSSPTILASDARARVRRAKFALVGTPSGVFDGDLTATSGMMALNSAEGGAAGGTARISTVASDGHPSVVVVPRTARRIAVFQRTDGLSLTASSDTSWSPPLTIPGTRTGDSLPSLALDQAGGLDLTFRRSTGHAPGIYYIHAARGKWSAPRRLSRGSGDTLPTIAVTGKGAPRIQVAFLRTRGPARGVYYVSSQHGRWSRAARVKGSSASAANPALGAPALAFHSGTLELAFARTGRGAGIYLETQRRSKWTALRRLTNVSGDSQPLIVIGGGDLTHIVFRRTGGRGARGLFELRGRTNWSLGQIPGTRSTDRDAALSVRNTTVLLAFARPSGANPGVYYDQTFPGPWLSSPKRLSTNPKDHNPSISPIPGTGFVTILFDRG